MISPHTPPGTALVVVMADRESLIETVAPLLRHRAKQVWGNNPTPFSVGDRFVLWEIVPNVGADRGFAACLQSLGGQWPLECFDVAALPSCLTGLLVPNKVPEDA